TPFPRAEKAWDGRRFGYGVRFCLNSFAPEWLPPAACIQYSDTRFRARSRGKSRLAPDGGVHPALTGSGVAALSGPRSPGINSKFCHSRSYSGRHPRSSTTSSRNKPTSTTPSDSSNCSISPATSVLRGYPNIPSDPASLCAVSVAPRRMIGESLPTTAASHAISKPFKRSVIRGTLRSHSALISSRATSPGLDPFFALYPLAACPFAPCPLAPCPFAPFPLAACPFAVPEPLLAPCPFSECRRL